jgi:hypothetical protein
VVLHATRARKTSPSYLSASSLHELVTSDRLLSERRDGELTELGLMASTGMQP